MASPAPQNHREDCLCLNPNTQEACESKGHPHSTPVCLSLDPVSSMSKGYGLCINIRSPCRPRL
jgi:hypothetical protein